VSLIVVATTFALVVPAELPDKTALASLVLGTRYPPLHVFTGVAAAFAAHVVLAVTAGGLLAMLPHRAVEAVVAVLFGIGALAMLRGREHAAQGAKQAHRRPAGFARVAGTSFAVVAVAEFGDLTQIVIASLAARYHDPVAVGAGSMVALLLVAGLAIVGGRGLLRIVPMTAVNRVGAAAMAALAVVSLISAVRG
jgi:putative Ca2+/H+ antiporter (TMEM165/GDT1 family)